jgi:hypothetical protein
MKIISMEKEASHTLLLDGPLSSLSLSGKIIDISFILISFTNITNKII